MEFTGFPERALVFYEGLLADNSKAYWTDHREVYDTCVAGPLRALMDELGPEFGEAKIFRPYRDVRFSKDKTPYKTEAAAVVHGAEGAGALYIALGADGLRVGGGYWHPATDQVRRMREAVAEDGTGGPLVRVLDRLAGDGWTVEGEQLVRVPKPWDAGHPRADLLRHKSLAVIRDLGAPEWLSTPDARERVAGAWRAIKPLNAWLTRHVGPSREPAPARR